MTGFMRRGIKCAGTEMIEQVEPAEPHIAEEDHAKFVICDEFIGQDYRTTKRTLRPSLRFGTRSTTWWTFRLVPE
jgi:hypothetical protein